MMQMSPLVYKLSRVIQKDLSKDTTYISKFKMAAGTFKMAAKSIYREKNWPCIFPHALNHKKNLFGMSYGYMQNFKKNHEKSTELWNFEIHAIFIFCDYLKNQQSVKSRR